MARGLVVLGLLTIDEPGELPLLYALLLTQMGLGSFFDAARTGALPDTVGSNDLQGAYALSAATWSVMLSLGGFVGGMLLAGLGERSVFWIDAATYGVSALFLLGLRLPPVASQEQRYRLRDAVSVAELRRAWVHARERGVRSAFAAKWAWGPCGGLLVLLPLMGSQRFEATLGMGRATAWLYAARGVGTGLGPLLARRVWGTDERGLRRSIAWGFAFGACGYSAIPLFDGFAWAFACVAFSHLGGSTIWVSSTVLWQQRVDGGFRGRAHALEHLGMAGVFSSWALAVGFGFDRGLSLDGALLVCGAAVMIGGLAWRRRVLRVNRGRLGA